MAQDRVDGMPVPDLPSKGSHPVISALILNADPGLGVAQDRVDGMPVPDLPSQGSHPVTSALILNADPGLGVAQDRVEDMCLCPAFHPVTSTLICTLDLALSPGACARHPSSASPSCKCMARLGLRWD